MAESGCANYTHRVVDLYFVGDAICCSRCPLLETYARKQCRRTGEYIVDDRVTGMFCPLVNPDTGEVQGDSELYNNFLRRCANEKV